MINDIMNFPVLMSGRAEWCIRVCHIEKNVHTYWPKRCHFIVYHLNEIFKVDTMFRLICQIRNLKYGDY